MCKQHYTVYSCSTPSHHGPVSHLKVHDTGPELCSLYLSTGSCPSRPSPSSPPALLVVDPSSIPDSPLKELTSTRDSLTTEKISSNQSKRLASPPPATKIERENLWIGNSGKDGRANLEDNVNYEQILHPVPQECRVCKSFRIWQKHKIMKRQREAEKELMRREEEKRLMIERESSRPHIRKCVIM